MHGVGWTCRAASSCVTVSRNCIMQMTHYVVATRLEWGVTLLRSTRSGSKEIGYDVLTDPSRRDSFPFLFPFRHVRDHDSQYRGFHHAPGGGRGMAEGVDHGNGLSFISRKISFMQHVPRGGIKNSRAKRTPMGVSCLRREPWWRVSCKSFAWFTRTVLAARILIMYTCRRARERREEKGKMF